MSGKRKEGRNFNGCKWVFKIFYSYYLCIDLLFTYLYVYVLAEVWTQPLRGRSLPHHVHSRDWIQTPGFAASPLTHRAILPALASNVF